ncbi:MAG: UDP-N-acetylenolpyruvoylglucosamine reductase [Betaproteobacteria bacterium RIFCSPLOWO2_02_FULL_65_24]|nr:MAG: UDP-N-acetylenolpyruvoylglucosamine reductase [Betaproteobacteria bacterium RIFCSPLOWO2_02_FULL_65_24]OGA94895.1 MAG: UDP-N-acetylenolpyruvoylglucosamine reductase [Betaproteobacteria bacterium RIFCSPLOWO2_12_FULL_66_14]
MHMAEQTHLSNPALRGRLAFDEPMRKHITWRTGGSADRAYVPADLDDAAQFLRSLPVGEPVYFIGLGSNLLVRDGGIRGTVILTHSSHAAMRMDGALIYAEARAASPKVARYAAVHGHAGAEFLAGIPGTVGGALAMNAGCYGSDTWDAVERVLMLRRSGVLRERPPGDFDIGYRHVALRGGELGVDEWFAAAWFHFDRGDSEAARRRIKELLQQRIEGQPLGLPNAGSVFRNPPGDHAARLIEACGLKGCAIGGARVSEKHANFIVNARGRGSAADIENLIEHVRNTVLAKQGVELIAEVRIVGEALPA